MFGGRENLRGLVMGTTVSWERSMCSLKNVKVKMSVSREEALFLLPGRVSEIVSCLKTLPSLPKVVVSLDVQIQGIDAYRLFCLAIPAFLSVFCGLLSP